MKLQYSNHNHQHRPMLQNISWQFEWMWMSYTSNLVVISQCILTFYWLNQAISFHCGLWYNREIVGVILGMIYCYQVLVLVRNVFLIFFFVKTFHWNSTQLLINFWRQCCEWKSGKIKMKIKKKTIKTTCNNIYNMYHSKHQKTREISQEK